MTPRDRVLVGLSAIACVVVATAHVIACGPFMVFRAYLSQTFWRPAGRYAEDLVAGLPPDTSDYRPYAGMTPSGGSPSLQDVRDAYRALFPGDKPMDEPFSYSLHWPDATIAHLRDVATAARGTTVAETNELELLRCKIELRAAKPDDKPALDAVGTCFDRYVAQPRSEALESEARGWRARVNVLKGEYAPAAKFYLDEFRSATGNIRRERLVNSLRVIQIHQDQLDEYFDTAAHALFAADRITTLDYLAPLRPLLIERLQQHRDLFHAGSESDALAVTLMRVSLLQGAPEATLRYASQVGANSAVREGAEFNWLLGASNILLKRFAVAQPLLEKALAAADAESPQATLAANGLIVAYAALGRPVDQLHAAFRLEVNSPDSSFEPAYLVDVQLSDADLEAYLARYGSRPIAVSSFGPQRPQLDVVRYALAVRHARHEEYRAAAKLYTDLRAPRAALMRQAADLFDATKATDASAEQHLDALYAYASFLADHENGIFFNNTLWYGFQTWAFVYRNPDVKTQAGYPASALPAAQEAAAAARERRFRDEQEEDWRAYQILDGVVTAAGHTAIGRKAATRAIAALRDIDTDRFGRVAEVKAADTRLSRWLDAQSDPR